MIESRRIQIRTHWIEMTLASISVVTHSLINFCLWFIHLHFSTERQTLMIRFWGEWNRFAYLYTNFIDARECLREPKHCLYLRPNTQHTFHLTANIRSRRHHMLMNLNEFYYYPENMCACVGRTSSQCIRITDGICKHLNSITFIHCFDWLWLLWLAKRLGSKIVKWWI